MWCACSPDARLLLWGALALVLAACGGRGNGSAAAGRASPVPPAVTATVTATPTSIPRRWDDLDCPAAARLQAALAPPTAPPADQDLARAGVQVLCALRAGRWDRVADYIHPRQGVVFSPDAYLDAHDLRFTAAEVARLPHDPTAWVWGDDPASGRPLALPFAEYAARYVYDGPYWEQGRPALDQRQVASTVEDNHAAAFPGSRVVEFTLPGHAEYGGLDARSLRLVFLPGEALPDGLPGTWCLVAIVHDAWAP